MMYITDLDKGHLILNSRRRLNWTRRLWPCAAEHYTLRQEQVAAQNHFSCQSQFVSVPNLV